MFMAYKGAINNVEPETDLSEATKDDINLALHYEICATRAPTSAGPPSPPASHKPVGGSDGDPHLHFAHGGRADYRGEDDAVVVFFSAPGIALNVKTEDVVDSPPWWPGTTIDGSFITEAHVVARVGGAKRKWANASFLASRLTEFNTGFDFITGSCGGHAFSFGLGTTLRRCEDFSIKPHYSSAKFEAGSPATRISARLPPAPHRPPPPSPRCATGPSPSAPRASRDGSPARSTSST